jgi:hypothetical protein
MTPTTLTVEELVLTPEQRAEMVAELRNLAALSAFAAVGENGTFHKVLSMKRTAAADALAATPTREELLAMVETLQDYADRYVPCPPSFTPTDALAKLRERIRRDVLRKVCEKLSCADRPTDSWTGEEIGIELRRMAEGGE